MDNNRLLVSIIIPVFNRGDLLIETLHSINKQSYKNWECILVDDGSSDNTLEIVRDYIKKDKRISLYKRQSQDKKGVNSCRKLGFLKSKGELICWFDSDDLMHEEKLSKTVELFKNEETDIVIHNFNYFRLNEYVRKPYNDFDAYNNIAEAYLSGDIILNFQSIIWKRTSISLELLRLDLFYAEDVFFIANHLLKYDFNVEVINKSLTHIRKHDTSVTSSFRERPMHLIDNEVYVRRYFWELYHKKNNYLAKGTLKMYLKGIKYFLHVEKYKLFFSNIFKILFKVDFKLKFIVTRLIILSLIYMYTKKGITLYKNLVNDI